MKYYKTLKLRAKLMLCLGILSMATFIIGGLGINKIVKINQRSQMMYNTSLIPALYLSGIEQALTDIHTYYLHVAYGGKEADLDILKGKIESQEELVKQYGNCSLKSEEIELYNIMKAQLSSYNEQIATEFEYLKVDPESEYSARMEKTIKSAESAQNILNELFAKARDEASAEASQNQADAKVEVIRLISIGIICLIIAYSLALIIVRRIARQIQGILEATEQITAGKLNTKIEVVSNDEIGQLADSLNQMVDNLNEVVMNIDAASEQVSVGAKQVAYTSTSLAQGATEQASTVEELTAAVEEINVQINQNAEHATAMNEIAVETKGLVEKGYDGMQEMLEAMENINYSSSEVAKIIKVIDDIAFQTNILALNAAVEAARAGQHGKGFTVVAEEVRNLAARSAEAAKETTSMIESSIRNANVGMNLAKDTAQQLNVVVNSIKNVVELTDEISVSCTEQAIGIAQINQGALQISHVVQSNSATSEEAAAASQELAGQAEVMRNEVEKFETSRKYVNKYREYDNEYNHHVQPYREVYSNRVGDADFGKY